MLRAAERHYRLQARYGAVIAQAAARAWDQVPLGALDSWQPAKLAAQIAAVQLVAGRDADSYVTAALTEQGIDPAAVGAVSPRSVAGVAGDGRSLVTLLDEPRIAAKVRIGQGMPARRAWEMSRETVRLMAVTAVQDAGRGAVAVAQVARPAVTGYVRMLNPPSCSRCAVLAGRHYKWNAGFARHPRCDCRHVPATEDTAGDLTTDPGAYFESLPPGEQDRIFTGPGAQAIRDGADVAQVVNARRGMQPAQLFGQQLRITTAGAARRGAPRLMPESIYQIAGDDRAEALRLLRLNGYLT